MIGANGAAISEPTALSGADVARSAGERQTEIIIILRTRKKESEKKNTRGQLIAGSGMKCVAANFSLRRRSISEELTHVRHKVVCAHAFVFVDEWGWRCLSILNFRTAGGDFVNPFN